MPDELAMFGLPCVAVFRAGMSIGMGILELFLKMLALVKHEAFNHYAFQLHLPDVPFISLEPVLYYLGQGSPNPGLRTGTYVWPGRNQAAQQMSGG